MRILPVFLRNTYWINDYLKGSPVGSSYRDIQEILELPEIGKQRRQQYLHQILRHATHYAPFYQGYSPKRLQDFPIVNKTILLENYEKIQIPINKILGQKGDLFIKRTSGSTGTPFSIPMNTTKVNRRIAELKYFGKISGFNSHENLIHLRTWNRWQNKSKLQSLRENIVPFNITHIDSSKLDELCKLIANRRTYAIRGYASSIDLLARYIVENRIELPSLRLIIAVSESLHDGTRELVEKGMKCKIISQYGNEENGVLAQESGKKGNSHTFYLNHATYFFEIVKFNKDERAELGELGRIVLTDFYNYAFPMIRYDTGDIGRMGEADKYSNGYPVLKELYGRRMDLVFDTKGNIVHPIALSRILKHFGEIRQWQFIQIDKQEYTLKLVAEHINAISDRIKKEIQLLFGSDAVIKINQIKEIPVLSSGKRKSVINKCKTKGS